LIVTGTTSTMGEVGDRDEAYDWVDDETLTDEQVRAHLDTLKPVEIVVPTGRLGRPSTCGLTQNRPRTGVSATPRRYEWHRELAEQPSHCSTRSARLAGRRRFVTRVRGFPRSGFLGCWQLAGHGVSYGWCW
jgi:hypothetical protein